MTTQERLIARLREECGLPLPEGTRLVRTRAGSTQRSQGAWSWFARYPGDARDGRIELGSHWPMTALLAAKRLRVSATPWGDTEIDPED